MGVLVMLTAMTTPNTCRKKAGEIMSMYRQEKKAKNRTVKNVYTVEQKRRNDNTVWLFSEKGITSQLGLTSQINRKNVLGCYGVLPKV